MTNNKQQTAVEWYIEKLLDLDYEYAKGLITLGVWSERKNSLIQQAKEMDREQKKHAYDWGETNGADECSGDGATHENFEQYYQETYGGNK